jgi:hypothetical protein
MSKRTIPKYSHHKATGQARVRIDGKEHWLGKHGSPESFQRLTIHMFHNLLMTNRLIAIICER